jgi:NADH:ubiquinone oxidoreductase subunit 3 (subunit A)
LVFDIEAVFIYPWAVTFHRSVRGESAVAPAVAAGEMFVFVVILVVGLVYAWRKGALDWEPSRARLRGQDG